MSKEEDRKHDSGNYHDDHHGRVMACHGYWTWDYLAGRACGTMASVPMLCPASLRRTIGGANSSKGARHGIG